MLGRFRDILKVRRETREALEELNKAVEKYMDEPPARSVEELAEKIRRTGGNTTNYLNRGPLGR